MNALCQTEALYACFKLGFPNFSLKKIIIWKLLKLEELIGRKITLYLKIFIGASGLTYEACDLATFNHSGSQNELTSGMQIIFLKLLLKQKVYKRFFDTSTIF